MRAQYQAVLSTADPAVTPALQDVTLGYSAIPPNHPPVAVDDAYAATAGFALSVAAPGVLANDTDADGDALTAALVTAPGHGTLALSPTGAFVFAPAAGFTGVETFAYSVSDGRAASSPAIVTITIAAAPHTPIANADTYDQRATLLNVAAAGLLASDRTPTVARDRRPRHRPLHGRSRASKTGAFSTSRPRTTAASHVRIAHAGTTSGERDRHHSRRRDDAPGRRPASPQRQEHADDRGAGRPLRDTMKATR